MAQGRPAGLKNVTYPTCTVAGEPVDTGNEARCFAQYMNIHALEATGGFTYSQMGIYSAKPGTPKSQLEPGTGRRPPALVRRFRVVLDGAAHFACLVGCAEATYEVQGHVDAR